MGREIAPDYFDPLAVDPDQARDVARWRRAERTRLRAERTGLRADLRRGLGISLADHLRVFLRDRFDGAAGREVSGYWPIKGEPDLRPLLIDLHRSGVLLSLPLVERVAAPLTFRRWTPETPMVRGHWNIPVPSPEAGTVVPEIALVPLLGWDAAGYRLGYGGGYFDRTLAAVSPGPFTIGVGYDAARLATIYPQPHDIPLRSIVTETGRKPLADET